ncbi:MAG: hypothetical protein F4114_12615 [Rhodospirillaceae bacterium]|nr:hypothetical protein [Rhodospirillaceae bacterium]MYB12129.1 hypothetical protein [Rhodospirillaceae bacterium]MYI49912.1 hypothetical protein [Rhodospirillaceae bacterium]
MQKSSGITPTEKHLARLCERAFLRLWSYPNLYRDQGGGKELCDVLIVFGHDAIVFSDKSCAYPDTGEQVRDWARWFKRSISASAQQVYGAERWIRRHPDRIFLDTGCKHPLPLSLPPSDELRVHRVVVARGAGERCSTFFGGDSGSLMVRSDLVGTSHINPPAGPFGLFRIGQLDPDRGYVHVLDDENLDILLSELDTIADFVAYLSRKEALLCSEKVVLATGEEDLLAYYLTHTNAKDEHDFVVPPDVNIVQFDHLYREMRDDERYIAKKSADEVSYLIDQLIDHVSGNVIDRTLIDGNELPFHDQENALRVLASEDRLSRRHLARTLVDLWTTTSARGPARSRCVVTNEKSGTGYCFLVSPIPEDRDYCEYRHSRSVLLAACSKVMKLKFPALQHVVGYATEPLDGEQRSQDLAYLDATSWTETDAQEARRLQARTELLDSPTITHFRDQEYPT